MTWVFTSITIVALFVLLVGEKSSITLRNIAKPVASAGFVGVAFSAGALDTTYGSWVFLGLVLGAAGDVLLLGASRGAFLAGLAAFLLGHVAYVVAFVTIGLHGSLVLIVGGGAAAVGAIVFVWLYPHLDRAMVGPVAAYIIVISAMLVTAAASTVPVVILGSAAFYLSDLSVARDRFVAPGFANRVWGLPLYYGAQLLLAWSVIIAQ
jgi:uncharacterized membrane protein YhhN